MEELKFINEPNKKFIDKFVKFQVEKEIDFLMVDWNMGNTCNYSCTYCDEHIHDGSVPWPKLETALEFTDKLTQHYKTYYNKRILWNLLGGEPTVWKDFTEFVKILKKRDSSCKVRILTNGSRTLNWWKKTAEYLDDIIISYHPESADTDHLIEVTKILREHKVFHTIQVCLYPPTMNECIRAAEQFHKYSRCNLVIIKALKKTLGSPETFDYNDNDIERGMAFDGEPIWTAKYLRDSSRKNIFAAKMFWMTDEGAKLEVPNVNKLMMEGKNSWEGWWCNIGLDTLVVDMFGNVTAGSSCNHEYTAGNISEPWNIKFPTEPTKCRWKWCSCIADIETTKFK